MNNRYLIIGGSGFIGRHLAAHLGPERCVATYYNRAHEGMFQFAPPLDQLDDFIDEHGPFTHAYVLMAMSNLLRCIQDKLGSNLINVITTKELIDTLLARGITPIFSSSDSIFDGEKGDYVESDAPNPLVTYGQQKLAVEEYLRDKAPDNHIIVRLSKTYGTDPLKSTLITAWLFDWYKGSQINCATDQRFCPIHVDDAAQGLALLADNGLTGTFHLGGPKPWTRAQLLEGLKQAYEANIGPVPSWNVNFCHINDFGFTERWPVDITMKIDKFVQATGFTPRDADGAIDEIIQRLAQAIAQEEQAN
ncbi:SDR family oxidoreductase [Magnetofaba australis]|uniref:Putative dTDP-4-dehydrorhamnose reductase n=1 Tax=Magnetofaba australis IT-1 TaxID=1434232 RepID=A0A1Y2K4Q7_9PROT|nr:sugar nucleotide-binding protein [Magnetofaba australis]OSM04206.1 putative dTDP-4-dehydrorhamnose reductase [Magnetofaba australis IT-1]